MTATGSPARPGDAGIDTQALRRRYRLERDKRLRPDGDDQYRLTGSPARLRTTLMIPTHLSPSGRRRPITFGWCASVAGSRA